MATLLFAPRASADLGEIVDYIGRDKPAAAVAFADWIETKCHMLAEQPGMGRARPELQEFVRSFSVGNYIIFYRPIDDGIEVVRVLSGFRDIPQQFGDQN